MAKSKNTSRMISEAKPHTIKKFELIEKYVDEWARKILGFDQSRGVLFVDCMSNSGVYTDIFGNTVYGTPIRIAKRLNDIIENYPGKKAVVLFNDIDNAKTQKLQSELDKLNLESIECTVSTGDANAFLKALNLRQYYQYNTLLLYDPYQASIDWEAVTPFLQTWGEVIINHMVSDTIRGVAAAKEEHIKQKYAETYELTIDELIGVGNNRTELERIIEKQIEERATKAGKQEVLISSFPFFNRTNVLVYDLIHCCKNIAGKKLFKKVAWQTFGGKSSGKSDSEVEGQLAIGMLIPSEYEPIADNADCYYIKDIAQYIINKYSAKESIPLKEVYEDLDYHPIFPSDGFKRDIKEALADYKHVKCTRDAVLFSKRV